MKPRSIDENPFADLNLNLLQREVHDFRGISHRSLLDIKQQRHIVGPESQIFILEIIRMPLTA